jgi:hypothetical protein
MVAVQPCCWWWWWCWLISSFSILPCCFYYQYFKFRTLLMMIIATTYLYDLCYAPVVVGDGGGGGGDASLAFFVSPTSPLALFIFIPGIITSLILLRSPPSMICYNASLFTFCFSRVRRSPHSSAARWIKAFFAWWWLFYLWLMLQMLRTTFALLYTW